MQYRMVDGTTEVAPWPFGVDSHAGYLVGYQLEGYPAVLESVVMSYRLGQLAQ